MTKADLNAEHLWAEMVSLWESNGPADAIQKMAQLLRSSTASTVVVLAAAEAVVYVKEHAHV